MERKTYIDNLRWICVLLLFPYHIFMIYNSFGENFYIKGADIKATTTFIFSTWPWFMPLLFAVAGISTAYALKKRTISQYVRERMFKLLIPLAAGLLLVIPAQTYFAERFHNGYTGGYFAQYILFLTKPTDLTGYAGGFTPGQLWFILYLFVISLAAVPVFLLYGKLKRKPDFGRMPLTLTLCLFILPILGSFVLDIGGKSLGEYFVWFLLGYFLLSDEGVQKKLEKHRFPLLCVFLVCLAAMILQWYGVLSAPWPVGDIFSRFYGWTAILTALGLGKKHLNFSNPFAEYMSRSSFAVYVLHQTWIIVPAYYVFGLTDQPLVQIPLILLCGVLATFATYEICRRFKVTRFLFAIKS